MSRYPSARKLAPAAVFCLAACGLAVAGCRPPEEAPSAVDLEGGTAASASPPSAEAGEVRLPIPANAAAVAIAAGEIHHRDFDLAAGDFLHVVAEQQGIDLAVRLLDPEGRLLIRVDSPNGKQGPEELVEVAAIAGRHRFEVVAPAAGKAASGSYTFRLLAHRPATARDRELVAADHAHHEGRGLWKQGQPTEALPRLRAALGTWERLGLPAREAQTLDALHRVYLALGENEVAAPLCDRAAERFEQAGDALQTAVALHSGAWIRLRLGRPEKAVEPLRRAIELYESVGHEVGTASALGNLGTASYALGQLQRAISWFDQALERAGRLGDDATEALLLCERGPVLLALDRPEEALDGYSRALEIYRESDLPAHAAVALTGVAGAAARLGDEARAETAVVEAISGLDSAADDADLIQPLRTLGQIRRRRGDLAGAGQAFRQAQERALRAGSRRGEAILALELGHLAVLEGEPARGLALHERAAEIYRELGDRLGQASARVRGAQALADLGRLEEAWRRLEPALADVEQARAGTERRDFRSSYFAFRQEYFEIGIDLLVRLHERRPQGGHHLQAFALNERRLARELVERLGDGPGAERAGADPVLVERERRLEAQLARAASRGPGGTGEDGGGDEIPRLLAQLQQVRAEIGKAASGDAASPPEPAVAEAAEVRSSLLDGDTLLLVYALGERRSVLWAVSWDGITVHTLPPRSEIEGWARTFSERIVERNAPARSAVRQAGRRLSDLLLGPVAPLSPGRRLLLVTEGVLQAVPFAALPEPGGEEALVRGHEIVNIPSATALAALRRAGGERPPGRPIAAFADPVFDAADLRVSGPGTVLAAARTVSAAEGAAVESGDDEGELLRGDLTRSAGRLGLDPFRRLPHTHREAEEIFALAPDGAHLLATGFAASRETLDGSDLGRYGILHFATHALAHPEHPELSGLVFSMVDDEGRPRDGFLRAYEIARLHLPADLVVLSACETGRGRDLRGEGMQSLTRSFFDAGAARVIATLWQVSDRASARLMARFYDGYLRRGLPPAAALRQAQLALLDDAATAEPYYWAGFLYHGDWRRPE